MKPSRFEKFLSNFKDFIQEPVFRLTDEEKEVAQLIQQEDTSELRNKGINGQFIALSQFCTILFDKPHLMTSIDEHAHIGKYSDRLKPIVRQKLLNIINDPVSCENFDFFKQSFSERDRKNYQYFQVACLFIKDNIPLYNEEEITDLYQLSRKISKYQQFNPFIGHSDNSSSFLSIVQKTYNDQQKKYLSQFENIDKSIPEINQILFSCIQDKNEDLFQYLTQKGILLDENQFLDLFFNNSRLLKKIDKDKYIELYFNSIKQKINSYFERAIDNPIKGSDKLSITEQESIIFNQIDFAMNFVSCYKHLYQEFSDIVKLNEYSQLLQGNKYKNMDFIDDSVFSFGSTPFRKKFATTMDIWFKKAKEIEDIVNFKKSLEEKFDSSVEKSFKVKL